MGAVSIHAAFVACSMSGGMSNALTSLGDAAADVLNLETSDAHADDGAAPACSCPVSPAPAETTFSLRVDRGSGPEEMMADWSSATVRIGTSPADDWTIRVGIQATLGGFLRDHTSVSLICSFSALANGSLMAQPGPEQGQTNVGGCVVGSALANPTTYLHKQNVQIARLDGTGTEVRVPSLTVMARVLSTTQTFRFTNIVIRHTDPSAHYLTPSRAYRSSP